MKNYDEYLKRIEEELDYIEDGYYSYHDEGSLSKPNQPLYEDAIALGSSPAKVYLFLWKAARMDTSRKIYNTNSWTIKGIADELKMNRTTVSSAINKLLDDGLLQIIDEVENRYGSRNTLWGITHPDFIDSVRYSIAMMGDLPSTRLKKMRNKGKKVDTSQLTDAIKDRSWMKYDPKTQTILEPAK